MAGKGRCAKEGVATRGTMSRQALGQCAEPGRLPVSQLHTCAAAAAAAGTLLRVMAARWMLGAPIRSCQLACLLHACAPMPQRDSCGRCPVPPRLEPVCHVLLCWWL
jgi:hypothetical protein